MDNTHVPNDELLVDPAETAAERQVRLSLEARDIAQADASIAAGYYATSAEVDAWVAGFDTDNPLPTPIPSRPRPL